MNKAESKYFNTAKKIDEAFLSLLDKKDFEFITVKEICQTAGVNRSTFYLHYETIDDLLAECDEYIVNKFLTSVNAEPITTYDIKNKPVDELNFITPKYLMPWLEFIKKNKKLFMTYLNKFSSLNAKKNDKLLFNNVVNPVLDRFNVREQDKSYLSRFYIEGVIAVVKLWVANGCVEDVEKICEIIVNCVNHGKN